MLGTLQYGWGSIKSRCSKMTTTFCLPSCAAVGFWDASVCNSLLCLFLSASVNKYRNYFAPPWVLVTTTPLPFADVWLSRPQHDYRDQHQASIMKKDQFKWIGNRNTTLTQVISALHYTVGGITHYCLNLSFSNTLVLFNSFFSHQFTYSGSWDLEAPQ